MSDDNDDPGLGNKHAIGMDLAALTLPEDDGASMDALREKLNNLDREGLQSAIQAHPGDVEEILKAWLGVPMLCGHILRRLRHQDTVQADVEAALATIAGQPTVNLVIQGQRSASGALIVHGGLKIRNRQADAPNSVVVRAPGWNTNAY